jgi:PAS domain S-box-containing protein
MKKEIDHKTLLKLASAMFVGIDNNGVVTLVNKRTCEVFGYTEEEIIGKNWFDHFIPNKIRKEMLLVSKEVLNVKDDTYEYYENLITTKSGEERLIQWNNIHILDDNGDTIGSLSSGKDITEQQKIKHELNQKTTKWENTINAIKDSVCILDIDGHILECNQATLKMYKLSTDDLKNNLSHDVFHTSKNVTDNCPFHLMKKTKKTESIYYQDNDSWLEITVKPFFNDKKEIEGALHIVRDVTAKVKTERELIVAKEKAEESDRIKTDFINNMSHEIRTPMTGILGFSDLLNSPSLSEEKRKKYISFIQSSGKQLLRIVEDILEISALGTKQVNVLEKEFCLNDLLLEQFLIFQIKAKIKSLPLYLKKGLPDKESRIHSDESKINKILSNLLENALKFTDKGFVEFGYTLIEGKIEIYVKDTGFGVEEKNQEMIFNRFAQEDKGLERNVNGLGLGLSIVKENVELLGGEVRLESEKGKGSTFLITIPYKVAGLEKTKKDLPTNEKASKKTENETILVVEDDETNHLYLEALLESFEQDWNILHAKNGLEAVEICKINLEICCVLMDLKMPVMDGFKASKLIKEFSPKLPIIAQTAYATREDKWLAVEAGCDDFISKPISKDNLSVVINKYIIRK